MKEQLDTLMCVQVCMTI